MFKYIWVLKFVKSMFKYMYYYEYMSTGYVNIVFNFTEDGGWCEGKKVTLNFVSEYFSSSKM